MKYGWGLFLLDDSADPEAGGRLVIGCAPRYKEIGHAVEGGMWELAAWASQSTR